MKSPIPDLIHGLSCLSAILAKAEALCESHKIDPDALFKARLYPDMFHLTRNVTTAQMNCEKIKKGQKAQKNLGKKLVGNRYPPGPFSPS